jgi:NAD(P)-dependent dehydrogenase (short-subunit alcohol dehydrogenase family)
VNVLIAGGTGELGLAVAERLAGDGHLPIVFGRSPTRAEKARQVLGERGIVLTGNVHDVASLATVITEAKRHGPVDAYIHNVGLGEIPERPLEHWNEEEFLAAVTNAERGLLTLLRLVQPQLVLMLFGNLALTPLPGRAAALTVRMSLIGLLRCWETERPGRRFTLVKMGKLHGHYHLASDLATEIVAAMVHGGSEVLIGDTYGV